MTQEPTASTWLRPSSARVPNQRPRIRVPGRQLSRGALRFWWLAARRQWRQKSRRPRFSRLRPGIPLTVQITEHRPLTTVMKILLGIVAVVFVAATFFADYKWRRWMAARRRDRQ